MIDPETKLPIWPDGRVPEHPRHPDGTPILPTPSWIPPSMFEPLLEVEDAPVPNHKPITEILESLQQQIDQLRAQIHELSDCVQRIQAS